MTEMIRYALLGTTLLFSGLFLNGADSSEAYEPKPRKFPTPMKTWSINGKPLYGRVVGYDEKSQIYEIEEFSFADAKETQRVEQSELDAGDAELSKIRRTGVIKGKVIKVTDGDTFDVLLGSEEKISIRLQGVDAPERTKPFSKKSSQKLSSLVFGKTITAHYQATNSNRMVCFVFDAKGKNINLEMVKAGLAWHYQEYLDSDVFAEAHARAKSEKIGLWHDPDPEPPWEQRAKNGSKIKSAEELKKEGKKIRTFGPRFTDNRKPDRRNKLWEQRRGPIFKAGISALKRPDRAEHKFWLNEKSMKRHNPLCSQFRKTKRGRFCWPHEGEACGTCGG